MRCLEERMCDFFVVVVEFFYFLFFLPWLMKMQSQIKGVLV